MKLSAPIYILKQQAKTLSQRDKMRLHVALDQIAAREGFKAWSHLASQWQRQNTGGAVYGQFKAGDLVLIGSRPGQGKTLLGIGLAVEAMARGNHAAFFTLEFTATIVADLFTKLGKNMAQFEDRFVLDTSDDICAQHITLKIAAMPRHAFVVVDYLQLLDQRRDKPPLEDQVRQLSALARDKQAVIVCLSQINRSFDSNTKQCPEMRDVRLPNPADLSLFNKACFLHNGKMQLLS
jgi:replicative DNA helicase